MAPSSTTVTIISAARSCVDNPMPSKRVVKKAESFQFTCYNAVHEIGKPASVKDVANQLRLRFDESDIRRVLNRLCKQKALTKSRIDRVWHYFV